MKPIFLLALSFCGLAASAQSDSTARTDSVPKAKPQFKISLNYNSNLHYYGRTDSIRSSGYFPMAEFWATPNFYINAAPIFVNNSLQSFEYAGAVATIGFQKVTKKWITGLYALKPFYTAEARLVQSALKAQTGASVTRLNKLLNLTLGADAKFSSAVDFGASAGIDHLVRIELGKGVFVIDPGVTVNAGTQQFSSTYVKKGSGSNSPLPVPLPGNNGGSSSTVTETGRRFAVLSYEATLPLIYARDHWMLLVTPGFVAPQNLVAGEYGKAMGYVTAGVKYTF
ncbi:hypothetical protein [Flaviaesturariibacter terrae]